MDLDGKKLLEEEKKRARIANLKDQEKLLSQRLQKCSTSNEESRVQEELNTVIAELNRLQFGAHRK